MTEPPKTMLPPDEAARRVEASLARRRKAERRFHGMGLAGVLIALTFLVILFASIFSRVFPASSNIMLSWRCRWRLPVWTRRAMPALNPFMPEMPEGAARGPV